MAGLLQHYLNPLHIYCRLRDFGLSKITAGKIITTYEKCFFIKIHLIRKEK